MAKKGDKFVLTIGEVIYGQTGKRLYLVDGFNSLVFDEEGLKRLDVLPFSLEDLTTAITQRHLKFAKESGRDFHMTITAEGETIIDVTVPTKTVTESKFYSIPDKEDDPDEDDDPDDCCDTCKFSGVPEKGYPCVECKHGNVSKYVRMDENTASGKEEASCQTCVYKDDDRFCKSCKRNYLDGYERKV